MRKFITAITAGLLLVAGQAAATANQQVDLRVGDRVGARAASSDNLRGGGVFVALLAAVMVLVVVVAVNDDSKSD